MPQKGIEKAFFMCYNCNIHIQRKERDIMNKKRLLALLICAAMIILTLSGCSESAPENKTDTPPDEINLSGEEVSDVTAITGSTDENGKVIDNKGIVDAEGHRIYDTGYKDADGNTIYTTGKKDANGNILYTLNKTDDRGRLIYYTGKKEKDKLDLKQTNSVPDYKSNENSKLDQNSRYSTTSTAKFEPAKDEKTAKGMANSYINYGGGSSYDMFRKVVADKNGGYIAVGISESRNGIYSDANSSWGTFGVVSKISDEGKVEWTYLTGGDNSVQLNDVAQLKDGSIVAVGYTSATDTDAPLNSKLISSLIIKLNKNGELQWAYSFPGDESSNGDYLNCVAATPDGGFVAGGRADSTSGFFNGTKDKNFKAFIFKFKKNGDIEWKKMLSGSKGNGFTSIDVNSDGDIFATCVSYSNDGSFSSLAGYGKKANTVVMKFNGKGELSWSSNLVGSGVSEYNAICATDDGGCLVGGKFSIDKRADGSYVSCYGKTDGYIVRFNKDGGVYWARNVGGTGDDEITSITATDNGIVVAGRTTSTDMDFSKFKNAGKTDAFVMIINSEGKTTYSESFGGSADDAILGTAATADGFVAVGWTSSSDGTFKASKAGKAAEAFYASFKFSEN